VVSRRNKTTGGNWKKLVLASLDKENIYCYTEDQNWEKDVLVGF
jgi:hypothetical protein